MHLFMIVCFLISSALAVETTVPASPERAGGENRRERRGPVDPLKKKIASIFLSETFINEQLAKHLQKSELIKSLTADFDAETDKLYLRGLLQLPLDDYRSSGIDASIGLFRFQLTVKPRVSRHGNVILEFPLKETFFYQAASRNPERDKVVIPVQLVSLGLASARGYLSALSGDFSSFDRKDAKIQALLRGTKMTLSVEKNPDAVAALKSEIRSLELELEANELQREQFGRTRKTLNNVLGFTGEDEFNFNNEIKARNNSLILKLKLDRLVPYLKGIELGDIRLQHNKRDGNGEDYFVFDVHTTLAEVQPPVERKPRPPREGLKIAPSILIRMNQDIFNSKAIVDAQKEKLGDKVKDFDVAFKDDGIHVTGKVKKWFVSVPFDSTVDFVFTGKDTFEIQLRQLSVLGVGFKFLTKFALNAVKDKLDTVLGGIATYEYLGDKGGDKAMKVTVNPASLIPAFPDLHLVDIDVRDRSFTMRVGRVETEPAKETP